MSLWTGVTCSTDGEPLGVTLHGLNLSLAVSTQIQAAVGSMVGGVNVGVIRSSWGLAEARRVCAVVGSWFR